MAKSLNLSLVFNIFFSISEFLIDAELWPSIAPDVRIVHFIGLLGWLPRFGIYAFRVVEGKMQGASLHPAFHLLQLPLTP